MPSTKMNIELVKISKSFGPVRANRELSLAVPAGTIMGVLGENGAGKSTLMKILSGFFAQDSGEILLDGQRMSIESPADGIRHGIGMLHQDPLDVPAMRVLDNFMLGSPGGLFPDAQAARRALMDLQQDFGFDLDPGAEVGRLTVGERQQLEILRLLWLGVEALILDEPTTGISAQQKERLFATLRRLAEEGKAIIFVTHKLEEIEGLCSQVAVLREGELVGMEDPPYDADHLVEMMFGKVLALGAKERVELGEPALELHNVRVETGRMQLRGIELAMRQGEVIGIAGMEGSGQQLLLQVCAGLLPAVDGQIMHCGRDMTGQPYRRFLAEGIAYLPASRMEQGLFPGMTLTEHFILHAPPAGMMIDWKAGEQSTREHIRRFNIRGRPDSTVESLSGGNQQRALLALLDTQLSALLMEHPTRGLDMESAMWVWSTLKERCRQGTSILFTSADLDEILHYSDRIVVFFGGELSEPLSASETTVEQLGQLIGGKGF
ncbi:MAG: ATP-binding cassette domain-containing protein [Anaerolineales bacterium]